MTKKQKQKNRYWRHRRVRAKIFGTAKIPRLCAFRSHKHVYAQLIDDEKGETLVAASDLELKPKTKNPRTIAFDELGGRQKPKTKAKSKELKEERKEISGTGKIGIAFEVGKLIAKKALAKKIKKVVFDRGGYKYHGRVKALAEGAREGGLKF